MADAEETGSPGARRARWRLPLVAGLALALAGGAGLQFAGESDALRHPEDNKDLNVFDPAVRRMTDRVLYKFKKPEEDGSHEN